MTGRFWWTARGLKLRTRALLALAAVTAAAPVGAGLAAHGWAMVLVLIAAFVVAEVLGKPWLLPGAAIVRAATPLARQVAWKAAGVLVLYGAGAGAAALTGWRPALPLWLPPAMVLGAGLASRAIWKPLPPAFDKLLDDGIAAIEGRGSWDDPPSPEEAARNARLRGAATLPDDASYARARAAVAAAMEALADDPEGAMDDFVRMLGHVRPNGAGRRGFILWATDPATLDAGRWPKAPARALTAAEDHPAALALFAERARAALAARPAAWEEFPTECGVRRTAVPANGARVNAALRALAETIRAGTPPEFRDGEDGSPLPPETRAIRQAERALARIPPGADDAAALAALATAEPGCFMALADLLDEAARGGDRRAARLLVLHATRLEVAGWLIAIGPLRRAFDRAEGDADLTGLFARRACAMIDEDMETIYDMPVPAELRARAAALPAAAGAVMALHAKVAPILEPAGSEA